MAILQPLLFPQVLFISLRVLPHFFQQLCLFSITRVAIRIHGAQCFDYQPSLWIKMCLSLCLQIMSNGGKMVNQGDNSVQTGCGISIFEIFKTQKSSSTATRYKFQATALHTQLIWTISTNLSPA